MGGVCGSGDQTADRKGFNRRDTQETVDSVDVDDGGESSSESVGYDPTNENNNVSLQANIICSQLKCV